MVINKNLILCLFFITIPSLNYGSLVIESPSIVESNFTDSPIITYRQTLQDILKNFIAKYFYQPLTSQHMAPSTSNSIPSQQKNLNQIATIIHEEIPSVSRNEALQMLEKITEKVFDPNDTTHISIHLNNMKDICTQLDPVIDFKTIDAIRFLLENQHRSSILDTVFWIQNISKRELDKVIPMNQVTASKTPAEKLKILRAKLATPVV